MSRDVVVGLVLMPAGLIAGLLSAPLAAPYVGNVPRRRRISVGTVTAVAYGLLGWRIGLEPVLVALLYLATVGTLLGYIDICVKRLPDRFTLPSYGISTLLLACAAPFTDDGTRRFGHALFGMLVLFLLYAVQAILVPRGIGLGDVKMSGVLGLYLGWFGQDAWVTGLLLTYLVGGLAAIGLMIVRRSRKGDFPFGPFMLAGALCAVLGAPGYAA